MRWFAVSDLHLDYAQNFTWLRNLSKEEYQQDALLLPGDLSADFSIIEEALGILVQRFRYVFFVPGNHDLWVQKGSGEDSWMRFERIRTLCASMGILDSPTVVEGVRVVPMFSWYDFSFGTPSEDLRKRWVDFRMCRWPADLAEHELTRQFHQLNQLPQQTGSTAAITISMSHFLPDLKALPERVRPERYFLSPVLGSRALGEQVQKLAPDYHIFGHTHLNNVAVLGKTTYINNAFGYPSESRFTRKRLVELPIA